MLREVKILIADDHPIFRSGLKSVIEKESGFLVVAEADSGAAALELIEKHQPEVAVLDLDMPEKDGFQVARELQNSRSAVSVVILTMHKDEMHFNQAIDLGVRGYLIKDSAAAEVVGCIKSVVAGREYFSPSLSSFLLNRVRRVSPLTHRAGINDLTPTERRILYFLAQLKTSREIADTLGISPRTVENHRARICSKLELQGSHALTKFALQNKDELS
jgi:DNA-binding NarL/FixJ family response regulator